MEYKRITELSKQEQRDAVKAVCSHEKTREFYAKLIRDICNEHSKGAVKTTLAYLDAPDFEVKASNESLQRLWKDTVLQVAYDLPMTFQNFLVDRARKEMVLMPVVTQCDWYVIPESSYFSAQEHNAIRLFVSACIAELKDIRDSVLSNKAPYFVPEGFKVIPATEILAYLA